MNEIVNLQIVDVHVEKIHIVNSSILGLEVKLGGPVITFVVLNQRRGTSGLIQGLGVSHAEGKGISTLDSVNVTGCYSWVNDRVQSSFNQRAFSIEMIDSESSLSRTICIGSCSKSCQDGGGCESHLDVLDLDLGELGDVV